MGMFYWDPTYSLVLIGMLLCMGASAMVNSAIREPQPPPPSRKTDYNYHRKAVPYWNGDHNGLRCLTSDIQSVHCKAPRCSKYACGIWAFALAVLFQLVTLPVEFNASARAVAKVEQYGRSRVSSISNTSSRIFIPSPNRLNPADPLQEPLREPCNPDHPGAAAGAGLLSGLLF